MYLKKENKMVIYILQTTYRGVAESPKIFDTEKKAKRIKVGLEKASKNYEVQIFEIALSLKMKSFQLVGD